MIKNLKKVMIMGVIANSLQKVRQHTPLNTVPHLPLVDMTWPTKQMFLACNNLQCSLLKWHCIDLVSLDRFSLIG